MTRLFSSKYIHFLKNVIDHNTSETTNSWDKKDDNSLSAFNGVILGFIFDEFSGLWAPGIRTRDLWTEHRDTVRSARMRPI